MNPICQFSTSEEEYHFFLSRKLPLNLAISLIYSPLSSARINFDPNYPEYISCTSILFTYWYLKYITKLICVQFEGYMGFFNGLSAWWAICAINLFAVICFISARLWPIVCVYFSPAMVSFSNKKLSALCSVLINQEYSISYKYLQNKEQPHIEWIL